MKLSKEEISKILRLLGSENRANARVATSILEGRKVYQAFITDLYIRTLAEEDGRKKKFLIRCIDNVSPENFNFHIQNIQAYLETLRLHNDSLSRKIARIASLLRLNGQVLLNYIVKCRQEFLQNLWENPVSYERRKDVLGFQLRQMKNEQWLMYLPELELKTLPQELDEFQKIEVLDLRNNLFSRLPDKALELKSLKAIDLKGNNIRKLPSNLEQFNFLEVLDLRLNPVEINRHNLELFRKHIFLKADLSEEVYQMIRKDVMFQRLILPCFLEKRKDQLALNLANLGLDHIPEGVYEMENIEILDLGNNRLNALPRQLLNLPQLRTIEIVNNFGIKVHPKLKDHHFIKVIGPGSPKWKNETDELWDIPGVMPAGMGGGMQQLLKQKEQKSRRAHPEYQPVFKFDLPEEMI